MAAETQVKTNIPLEVADRLSLESCLIRGLVNCLSLVVDAIEEDHRGEMTVIALRYLELELCAHTTDLEGAVKGVLGADYALSAERAETRSARIDRSK